MAQPSQASDTNPPPAAAATGSNTVAVEAAESAFPRTRIGDQPEVAPDWWSESTDGQCSENAALFAASQPAPLTIV